MRILARIRWRSASAFLTPVAMVWRLTNARPTLSRLQPFLRPAVQARHRLGRTAMNGIVYIVGAVVIVLAILSFLGLR